MSQTYDPAQLRAAMTPAEREEVARILATLGPLRSDIHTFRPQAQQLPILRCKKRGCLALGGNRAGKTTSGGVETAYRLLGDHPYKKVHATPIRAWICSQDLPGRVKAKADGEQETHKQLDELKRWLPSEALRGGNWETAFSPGELTLSLTNGSLAVFKGYDQGLLKFESDAVHWVWFDEEPDDRRIWTSARMRLADYDGQWLMTATPVLSLLGRGWIEQLYEKQHEPGVDYEVHHLFSYDNPYLQSTVLDELFGSLTDEEREVRSRGMFARIGGRVLSEYDSRRHLVDDFIPPKTWRHLLLIDPGFRNPTAGLFAAIDPEGSIWLYGEHYQDQWLAKYHLEMLDLLWMAYGRPELDCVMDPAGFSIKRTTTGRENPSDADEYRFAADAHDPPITWLNLRHANNDDPHAYRVKRYLKADMLHICRSLVKWQWEAERWTYAREKEGIVALEKPVPEKPVDRNNHLMDLTRYLCNELPDPLPIPTQRRTDLEIFWDRFREPKKAESEVW